MDHAKRGAEALTASRYADAVDAYTQAIKSSPNSPDYHIKRSTAYQRSSPPEYAAALADAERAVTLARERAKRELIIQAQLRRAIALYGLERYGDAKFVFEIVKGLDSKEKTLGIWEGKVQLKLKDLSEDDARAKVTVTEVPSVTASAASPPVEAPAHTAAPSSECAAKAASQPTAPAQTPIGKIRHDWYQNHDNVIFTLLAKGVPKEGTVIDIQERSLAISFPVATGSTFEFSLDPLYARIDVSQSRFSVLSTKVEITLRKAQPGQKWHALESNEPAGASEAVAPTISPPVAPTSSGPVYPSSSRSGPKNWDKLADELTAKKAKRDGAKGTKDDDDWDYEKEDGDEVNSFFKKLYAGADSDTRRAMTKSFLESNGTALSTNWADVGKKTVPTQPPDGVEAKPWK